MHIVDYCRYADWGYKKPTCLWTNHPTFKPLCCQFQCNSLVEGTKHHISTLLLKKDNSIKQKEISILRDRYRVPPKLILDLIQMK